MTIFSSFYSGETTGFCLTVVSIKMGQIISVVLGSFEACFRPGTAFLLRFSVVCWGPADLSWDPPAFLILGGQRPARSQLPGHGFDQNRYIRGLGDVFSPRARRKLRGDRGSGRARRPEWTKNQGFSTLALSAGAWKESATENDCP